MKTANGKKLVRQSTCPAVIASKDSIPFCIPPFKSSSLNGGSEDSVNAFTNAPHISRRSTASSLGTLNKDLYIVDQYELQDKGSGTDGFFSSSISTAHFPADHVGRVWFSLTYENEEEKLILSLLKARNLRRSQSGRSSAAAHQDENNDETRQTPSVRIRRKLFAMSRRNSSPLRRDSLSNERHKVGGGTSRRKMNTLVNIYLLPDNRASGQAKCKKVDIDPVFADRFVFQLSSSELKSRSLQMIFIEIDDGHRHHVIGHVTKPLATLRLDGQLSYEDLEKGQPQGSKDSVDCIDYEILLSLCYQEELSRLTVVLLRMKLNMSPESMANVEQEIGIKLNICGKCSKEKKCRTTRRQIGKNSSQLSASTELAMNESFRFDLKQSEFDLTNLAITVKSKARKQETASFVALGGRMFARGDALDHWTKMTTSHNQFIQQWHTLSSASTSEE